MRRLKKWAIWGGAALVVLCIIGLANRPKDRVGTPTPPAAAQASATPSPLIDTATPERFTPEPSPTVPPTEPPAATPTNTMTENLAIIEGVEGDAEQVTRIALLLVELDKGYPETEQEIGDLTAKAHAVLADKGKPATIIEIMEEMLKLAGSAPGLTYEDAVIGWMTLRTS